MKICCWIALLFFHLTVINNPWAQDSFVVREHGELIFGEGLYYESAFSPDDQYIAGVNTTGISIWNAETFELLEHVYQDGGFHFLKWHPSLNTLIASNTVNSNNVIYDFDQREIISTFKVNIKLPFYGDAIDHPNIVNFSKENPLICFLSANNTLILYDYMKNIILHNQSVTEQELYSVGFLKSGNIWAGTKQGSVFEINKETFQTSAIFNGDLTVIEVLESGQYLINYSNFELILDSGGVIRSYWLQSILNNDERHHICRSQNDRDLPTPSRFKFNQDQSIATILEYTGHTFPIVIQYNINTKERDIIEIVNKPVISTMPLNNDHSIIIIKNKKMTTIDFYEIELEEEFKLAPQQTTGFYSFSVKKPHNFIHSYITSHSKLVSSQRQTNIWNLTNETIEQTFYDDLILLNPSEFSNDGQLFGTFFNMWNAETWVHLYDFNLEWDGFTHQVRFSHDDKHFALAKNSIWIIDTESGELVYEFEGHPAGTISIDFSMDGDHLISCGHDGSIKKWNLINGNPETIYQHEFNQLQYVQYINHNSEILHVGEKGEANILHTDSNEIIRIIDSKYVNHTKKAVAVSENEQYLFVGNQIWDIESADKLAEYGETLLPIESIKISPDNQWFATRHQDQTIRVWELAKVLQEETSVGQFKNY